MCPSLSAKGANLAKDTDCVTGGGAYMDWTKAYRPERKCSWDEIAQIIHDTVTMEEVLRAYCPSIAIRGNRCPCPLHDGKGLNFSFTANGFKCFVCGASGDVIGFVKDYCGYTSRVDAMKRMNSDLCLRLPIGGDMSLEQDRAIRARVAQAKAEREKEEAWWAEYHRLLDEWIEYDKTRRTANWESPEYVNAVKNIDRVSYEIDCLLGGRSPRLST